ncbi:B3 domain-containing protein At5g60142-like isoform X1 [Salvia splendens]|uniref:B3 domain-containing protein At5g60142-like isoform X1 n=2 Tax=Salvia splendens TaxID=180675 RepID=UPI001C2763E6|nr:B3 domain-containing protein At5g60142-like isoform X1 [Salvia splendens]XP_042064207.1 B3 domain-containing protein At5g60142-like isoform X1 [Salvia splendens]
MVNRPAFFKFYVPWLGKENQKIPPRFIQSLPGNWPKNLSLRDRYNNLWNVKVEMIGGDWYFKDGWEKFADDNKIKGGDMFIYEYFSHGLLDFKIHGGNACLTEGAGGRITRTPDYGPIGEGHTHENYDDKDDHDSTPEGENPWDDQIQGERVTDVKEANHRVAHTVDEESRDDAPLELARDGTASSSKRYVRRTYDWYGVDLFKTGFIPPSPNPYFVTQNLRNRAYEFYIPMDVIKSYNLKLPENVMFLDPKGRQFPSKRKMWADQRTFYTGGWKSLCNVNNVEDKDSCICEFLYNADDLWISVSFSPPK